MNVNALKGIKNFFPIAPPSPRSRNEGALLNAGGSFSPTRNLGNRRMPIQMPRIRQTITNWRAAVMQAEQAWWPFRVLMQQMFDDTVLELHVAACMERRRNLTLLREFEICGEDGKPLDKWTKYFHKKWFRHDFLSYALDARFYGYNLISLGDFVNNAPKNPTIISRWHISPDRQEVGQFVYSPVGYDFSKGTPSDYHVFVTTPTENGVSSCGYGLLYKAAMVQIMLKNNLGWNSNFVEIFGQPIRQLKTNKTEGAERDEAERALEEMGSCAYILTDTMEELILHSANTTGTGYKAYNDLDSRLKADISKLFLGHQDAISAVPGKNGNVVPAGGPTNDEAGGGPIASALRDIQTSDAMFIEPVVTDELFPKLRRLGIRIDGELLPEGAYLHYLNDAEERAIQGEKNMVNQNFATAIMTLAQAGKNVDNDFIEKTMGYPSGSVSDMPVKAGTPEGVTSANTPTEKKTPKDAIESGTPFKERNKNRPGKQ